MDGAIQPVAELIVALVLAPIFDWLHCPEGPEPDLEGPAGSGR